MRQSSRTIGQARTCAAPHRHACGPRPSWHAPPSLPSSSADRRIGRPCMPVTCLRTKWRWDWEPS